MNNQVFLQSDITVKEIHEETILNSLIQAQLDQSLSDIEALLDTPTKIYAEERFIIHRKHDKSDINEDLLGPTSKKRFVSIFRWFRTLIKCSW